MRILFLPSCFALIFMVSCQGSPEVKPSTNDNTAIKVPGDAHKPDTVTQAPAKPSYSVESSDPQVAALVKSTLQEKFKKDLARKGVDSFSRRFAFFAYDLNDDGKKEIFVALTGPYFCGSGGCSPMILDDQGKLITQFSVSDYPIAVSSTKSRGWKDLYIMSAGKYHVLKFDGKKYPSNPSVQPVSKLIPGDGLPRLLDVDHEPYPWFNF